METEHLVAVQEFCQHHEIEFSFINSLNDYGLIEITTVEETQYIYREQMKDIEKMVRLHHELDINMEGIGAITHLLQRIGALQEEVKTLKNRLSLYENE